MSLQPVAHTRRLGDNRRSNMAKSYSDLNVGYVYVLFNEAVPDYVKVGMTTRDANERAKELSNTGVPGEWKVHFSVFVPDCEKVEQLSHEDLDKVRYSSNREFFDIPLVEAERIVKRRAQENISQYPGWPDPQSVNNHLDRIELEKKKAIEENCLRLEHEKQIREKERIEAERKEFIERKTNVDKDTKKTLASWPVGWGTMLFATFWLIIGGDPAIKPFAVIGTILAGMWLRKIEKNKAIELRKKWELPPM